MGIYLKGNLKKKHEEKVLSLDLSKGIQMKKPDEMKSYRSAVKVKVYCFWFFFGSCSLLLLSELRLKSLQIEEREDWLSFPLLRFVSLSLSLFLYAFVFFSVRKGKRE